MKPEVRGGLIYGWNYVVMPPRILLPTVLVVLAYVIEPSSFERTWNQGRPALLAIIPLLALEMGRKAPVRISDWRRSLLAYGILAASAVYFAIFSLSGTKEVLARRAVEWGVDPLVASYSWVWAIDYSVVTFLLLFLVLLMGPPRATIPPLYTTGITLFLLIDAFLPYDSLGALQAVVPPILRGVALFVTATGLGSASAQGNVLILRGEHGSMNLAVFWPSAGLHSIIITHLVLLAMMIKLRTGWTRGLTYLLAGLMGSFVVNIIRITVLALYAIGATSDPQGFERFHSVAGELLFLPWITGYLAFVVRREVKSVSNPAGRRVTSSSR